MTQNTVLLYRSRAAILATVETPAAQRGEMSAASGAIRPEMKSKRRVGLVAHAGRISTSGTGRNRSAASITSERQLSTGSVSKAVIPLTAEAVWEVAVVHVLAC